MVVLVAVVVLNVYGKRMKMNEPKSSIYNHVGALSLAHQNQGKFTSKRKFIPVFTGTTMRKKNNDPKSLIRPAVPITVEFGFCHFSCHVAVVCLIIIV